MSRLLSFCIVHISVRPVRSPDSEITNPFLSWLINPIVERNRVLSPRDSGNYLGGNLMHVVRQFFIREDVLKPFFAQSAW